MTGHLVIIETAVRRSAIITTPPSRRKRKVGWSYRACLFYQRMRPNIFETDSGAVALKESLVYYIIFRILSSTFPSFHYVSQCRAKMAMTFHGSTIPSSANICLIRIFQLQKSLVDHGKHFGHRDRKTTSTSGFAPSFQKFSHGVSTPTSPLTNLGETGLEVC